MRSGLLRRRQRHDEYPGWLAIESIEWDGFIRYADARHQRWHSLCLAVRNRYAILHACRHLFLTFQYRPQSRWLVGYGTCSDEDVQKFIDYAVFVPGLQPNGNGFQCEYSAQAHQTILKPDQGKVNQSRFSYMKCLMSFGSASPSASATAEAMHPETVVSTAAATSAIGRAAGATRTYPDSNPRP